MCLGVYIIVQMVHKFCCTVLWQGFGRIRVWLNKFPICHSSSKMDNPIHQPEDCPVPVRSKQDYMMSWRRLCICGEEIVLLQKHTKISLFQDHLEESMRRLDLSNYTCLSIQKKDVNRDVLRERKWLSADTTLFFSQKTDPACDSSRKF